MKKLMVCLVMGFCVARMASGATVDIYSEHGSAGGGAPYSGLVGSFSSPDIMFATNTGYNWHPFGQGAFGADITGCLNVAADRVYSFTLSSDDGSLLFIDGTLVIDNGGAHGPSNVTNVASLTAGLHPFEVQFYEDFGGESGVDLHLPEGVTYGNCSPDVPEPSALLVWSALGMIGAVLAYRRKTASGLAGISRGR